MEKSEKIKKAYIEYLLENGQRPTTVFAFAKKLKMAESEMYEYFNSFEQLEQELWTGFFEETCNKIEKDEVFAGYSTREKVLSFYFTWFEVLKTNRSFVLQNFTGIDPKKMKEPAQFEGFKQAFKLYFANILMEGRERNEVKERKYLSERYPDAFWLTSVFLLDFWRKDTSKGFEKTDSAIEKSVNAAFDLIGPLPLDSVFDFAKFLYQNR